jgi:hypothetical protein
MRENAKMTDAERTPDDRVERVARAMAKSCGQRIFEDFDDPNAGDDRDWWRARARVAIDERIPRARRRAELNAEIDAWESRLIAERDQQWRDAIRKQGYPDLTIEVIERHLI